MGQGHALLADGRGVRLEGVLTADELGPYFDELAERLSEKDEVFRDQAHGVTDTSGNLLFRLVNVPAGYVGTVNIVTVEAAGYTPQSAYSGAGAGVNLYRTHAAVGNLLDFTPSTTGVLPCLFRYGSDDGPILQAHDRLAVQVVAGPASTDVFATVQGILRPSVTP